MTVPELLDTIRQRGGLVALEGHQVRYDLRGDAASLTSELIAHKEEVRRFLRERTAVPQIPEGFRLMNWNPNQGPALVEVVSVIGDPVAFAFESIQRLQAARDNPAWRWTVPFLLDQLAQVGVVLTTRQDGQDVQDGQIIRIGRDRQDEQREISGQTTRTSKL